MVKYICDRCGVDPAEDYKNPVTHTFPMVIKFMRNDYTIEGRNLDLCGSCLIDAKDMQAELSKVFQQIVGKFITERKQ